jgi:KipI family sensor histidine kinase inhibitor
VTTVREVHIRAYGPGAVLVETTHGDRARSLADVLRAQSIGASHRLGWSSVLVSVRDGESLAELGDAIRRAAASSESVAAAAGRTHVIPVRYDGADLHDVALASGCTDDEVVSIHTAATYTVRCLGFTRAFPYLSGLDPRLHVERRSTSRASVPAGSVAIAADQAGIYPIQSPGGWHLLGSTTTTVFDESRNPPGLFRPGDLVRFEVL